MRRACAVLVACAALGCDSPEAARSRGGGPGADQQNRPEVVLMHGGSQPFWETPVLIPGDAGAPSLEPALHARDAPRPQ